MPNICICLINLNHKISDSLYPVISVLFPIFKMQLKHCESYSSYPSSFRKSFFFLQFFFTFTHKFKKTFFSRRFSISSLASLPTFFRRFPSLPIIIPFWESLSTYMFISYLANGGVLSISIIYIAIL